MQQKRFSTTRLVSQAGAAKPDIKKLKAQSAWIGPGTLKHPRKANAKLGIPGHEAAPQSGRESGRARARAAVRWAALEKEGQGPAASESQSETVEGGRGGSWTADHGWEIMDKIMDGESWITERHDLVKP